MFDYIFSENGPVAHKDGVKIGEESLKRKLGDQRINELAKFTLRLLPGLDILAMRGTFIKLRNRMFNVSPIERNCSQEEYDKFATYNAEGLWTQSSSRTSLG